ncbi:MAG: STAS domain-containing protein [Pseudomonadota bacterium]
MKISIEKDNGLTVVSASGKMDAANCGELEGALDRIITGGGTTIILNLDGLLYISSAGLRVLLKTAKNLRSAGIFVLCALSENVKEIIEMSGFSNFMNIYSDISAAKLAIRSL